MKYFIIHLFFIYSTVPKFCINGLYPLASQKKLVFGEFFFKRHCHSYLRIFDTDNDRRTSKHVVF